jgi:hypothetical protein
VDSTFAKWRDDELVWLPARGMGYLRVTEQPYDGDYFRKYQQYALTPLGRQLTRLRVQLVHRYLSGHAPVLDVGIGSGSFVAQRGRSTFGYDIMPAAVDWLKTQGLYRTPADGPFAAVTCWDALEHIPDPAPVLAAARHFVFVSLPIVPGDGPPSPTWRHVRKDEHCWYWTRDGLIGWMREHGFGCVEHGTPESLAGREDIGTFVFRRES